MYMCVFVCICLYMCVCVRDGEGTFLLFLSCLRRLAGFGAPSARCVLVCSHPIVWNPKSKDFWEKTVVGVHALASFHIFCHRNRQENIGFITFAIAISEQILVV